MLKRRNWRRSPMATLKRRRRLGVTIGVDCQRRRLSVAIGVGWSRQCRLELNRRWFELHWQWFELHRRRLSSTATMGWSCRRFGVGFLVFFFFFFFSLKWLLKCFVALGFLLGWVLKLDL